MFIQDRYQRYSLKKKRLQQELEKLPGQNIRIKRTGGNLFRYQNSLKKPVNTVALSDFNQIIALDPLNQTLDVEGLATYEAIVNYSLEQGYLPTIAPELKHITVAGAIVGIGIESSGFKYGFVHDGLLEAEVLLPHGEIVLCNGQNEHRDLFYALPNSYGSLGYILRAKIKLYPAKAYIKLVHQRFDNIDAYLKSMQSAATQTHFDFIEGLFYDDTHLYLTTGIFCEQAPATLDIYQKPYYRSIQESSEIYLHTVDYIFRFDPDWFWNVPETPLYQLFRKVAPKAWRHSGFYKKYVYFKARYLAFMTKSFAKQEEPLIQDWEVPWEKAKTLIEFVLQKVDLQGRPWVALPIKPLSQPSCYPVKPEQLLFNLGCYCYLKQENSRPLFETTKEIDKKCFELGGIKMLYSSTFIDKHQFDIIYNGHHYDAVKRRYDPKQLAPNLYEKVVLGK